MVGVAVAYEARLVVRLDIGVLESDHVSVVVVRTFVVAYPEIGMAESARAEISLVVFAAVNRIVESLQNASSTGPVKLVAQYSFLKSSAITAEQPSSVPIASVRLAIAGRQHRQNFCMLFIPSVRMAAEIEMANRWRG
jgi:hypothetical protein